MSRQSFTQVINLESIAVGARMRHNHAAIGELAASLEEHGLLQPIVVRHLANGQYSLVAGGRRLQAARRLGWSSIPARVLSGDAAVGRVLELVENLQRLDLAAPDEAEAFEELLNERGWSNAQLAAAIKRSPSYISKRLRVFRDPRLREAVLERRVAVTTAEELLSAPAASRARLLRRAIEEGWDASDARVAVHRVRRPRASQDAYATGEHTPSRAVAGLSGRMRELRLQLRTVNACDLSDADRRELRSLHRELGRLARQS